MADQDVIIKPRSASQLHQALQDLQIFEGSNTWAKFQAEFLEPLRKALDRGDETVLLGKPTERIYDIESILTAFPSYLKDEGRNSFRSYLLPKWGLEKGNTISSDDPAITTLLRQLDSLNFASKNPSVIQQLSDRIEEIISQETPAEPSDEDTVRKRLSEYLDPRKEPLISLAEMRSELDEVLGLYEESVLLEVPDDIRGQLDRANENDKDNLRSAIDRLQNKHQKELTEALEADFDENWERTWIGNDRAELTIKTLRELRNSPDSELSQKLVDDFLAYLSGTGALPTPLQAELDLDVFFTEFLRDTEPALEKLKSRHKELTKAQEDKLKAELDALFAPPTAAPAPTEGGEKPEEEEVPLADKAQTNQAARQRLLDLAEQTDTIDDSATRLALGNALTTLGQQLGFFAAGTNYYGDLRSIFELGFLDELDRLEADENITAADYAQLAQRLLNEADSLVASYIGEVRPQPEELPPTAPGALATELPTDSVSAEHEEKRQAISDLMNAQRLMVTQAMEELRRNLEKAKIPPDQIEQILERNREMVSQQVWMEFLQRGGLQGELKFSEMATIWSGVVQQNTQRILIEIGLRTDPLIQASAMANVDKDQIKRLQKTLKEAGYSEAEINEIFSNLSKSRFEELAAFSRQSASMSREQKVASLKSILAGRRFAETDAGLAAGLIADNNLFGLLQHELTASPSLLTMADRRKLQSILQKTSLSAGDEKELSRLLSLLLKKYPPEVFYHLNSQDLAEIHDFLARQQKAMQIIGAQLANYPKGANFTNPYLTFTRSDGSRVEANVMLAGAAGISDSDANKHAKDTLMLEITLSMAFETRQDVNIALVMQQYYADPRAGLMLLASGLAGAYDENGELLPEAADFSPAQLSQLAQAQHANYAVHGQNQQAAAQAQQQNEQAQKMALLRAVLASGGNPALLAKNLLTDPNARGALMAEFEKHKFEIIAAMALPVVLPLAMFGSLLPVIEFVADAVNFIAGIPGAIGNFISGAVSGITGGTAGGLTGTAAVGAETGANAATAAKVAAKEASATLQTAGGSTVTNVFAATNAFLTGTTTAFTPLIAIVAAVIGPMAFAIIMTFTVFSVIAGSLNGGTTEIGLLGGIPGIGRTGCWPVDGSITDLEHPRDRVIPGGTAIDIGAPLGTPIYAPFSGTARARFVTDPTSLNYGYGRFVDMRTQFGFRAIFAHMVAFRQGVSPDETFTVEAGEVIGYVGSSGRSTGNHVHYETIGVNLYTLLPVPRNQLRVGYPTSTNECGSGESTLPATPSGTLP